MIFWYKFCWDRPVKQEKNAALHHHYFPEMVRQLCVDKTHYCLLLLRWAATLLAISGIRASAEIFPGGGAKSTFCLSFSGCWRCNAHGRSQTLYPFNTTKKMPRVTATVPKNTLRWQQCFFFTQTSFHAVENYVTLSRFITCYAATYVCQCCHRLFCKNH